MPLAKGQKYDCAKNYCRERVVPPSGFAKGSLRTKALTGGRLLIIGCPKGKWKARVQHCTVGTRVQSILRPYSNAVCKRACPIRRKR